MLTVVASAVSAFGLYIFVFGNSFAPSGIDGIATMLQEMTKINAGLFTLILNLPLLIAAWFILKRRYVISFVCYIKSAYSTIIGAFGKVDIQINGAGGNNPKATCDNETMSPEMLETEGLKDFFALDESGLKFVFDLNITSAFLVTQVFAEGMVKTGGNIINISSMNAFRPLTKIPAYSAAKAGVSNFTEWLAVHFAPCHIRCNAIAPGFFVTNQNRALLYNEDGTPTARTGKILSATPISSVR